MYYGVRGYGSFVDGKRLSVNKLVKGESEIYFIEFCTPSYLCYVMDIIQSIIKLGRIISEKVILSSFKKSNLNRKDFF